MVIKLAKTTMKDVAKRADVSVATVSNVLNNIPGKTNDATKQKVLTAVRELNYKVDMTARSLSMGKSNLLGIFLPEVHENSMPSSVLKGNPFYSEILSGIEYEARLAGYDLLISCVQDGEHALDLASQRMLDGIAVIGEYSESFWNKLHTTNIPVVTIDNYSHEDNNTLNVGIDDELGAYLATRHLITLGHKRIAHCTGSIRDSGVNAKRYNGFKRAIKEAGFSPLDCPVIEEDISFRGGITVGHRLLKDYLKVTAAFAAADIMALGIIKIMHQFGKKVPDDLSVIGFDDLKLCEYTFPALTTIRQDIFNKGVEVARLMIKMSNKDPHITSSNLPVELIIRDTTRAYRPEE